MKHILAIFFVIFACLDTYSQVVDSLTQEVAPKGGVNQLAITYYGIDFSKEQRAIIKDVEIEFVYSIDVEGNILQTEINGISDPIILDSLQNKTNELPPFIPRIRDGIAQASIYFVKLTFPTYQLTRSRIGLLQGTVYNEAKLEDFEYLKESGQNLHVAIGGVTNQFLGAPSKHLAFGGGMKLDMGFTAKNEFIYGMNMSFYANKLKLDYPLNSTREQFTAPSTALIGLIFGKWYNKFNVQAEINFGVQNVIERIGENDPDWIQLEGWSPGVVVNYPIKLGKDSPMYYYGSPTLFANNLNLHFGLRYIKLTLKEATGVMAEIGLSYKMDLKTVSEYKLKDEYLNR